ncbi:helix-turn-helix domain-containing protein [Pseudobutyrivibrio sp. JW11]|uniref:helix-turn-helix domain-containing protein n=1 Tax=Pseudobutyrivibrio sp. JW11 TaxID=1855302 RepID=UPI001A9A48A9|nr:helix-turn-helix transcriptional regulator [Pseudobutyrivibrio sp. JW11]
MFYTLSLVIAGILNDKSRGLGFILCLVALSFAFALPIMHDNTAGVYVTWVLAYVFIGFISVCRTVIFLDIAKENNKYYLAPIGLFIGRVGEPIGMQFRFWLANNNALLLVVISILFAVTIVLFAIPFAQFYGVNTRSDEEIDYHGVFIDRYQLSSREVQILDELLSGNANKEIAANLYITESTVKFHVKNLMKKTNCKNRNELIKLYNTENRLNK